MEELAEMVDHNGQCVVENFTVGRKGNGPSTKNMYAIGRCMWYGCTGVSFIYTYNEYPALTMPRERCDSRLYMTEWISVFSWSF